MILALSDSFRKLLSLRVPSRCLCKFKKGFSFPGAVEVRDDPEDDAVTTLTIGKAGHGAGAAAHFAEGALDDVGGAHLDPVSGGNGEKVQQGVEVALDASDGRRATIGPALLPVAESVWPFTLTARTIDGRSAQQLNLRTRWAWGAPGATGSARCVGLNVTYYFFVE